VESSSSIIQIFRVLLYTIGDAAPQEVFYSPKVEVNMMSKTMADHVAPEEPPDFLSKVLEVDRRPDCEEYLKMGHNKAFLDFHIFDIPKGEEFILIGQPIEPLVNPNRDQASLKVKVGKDRISVSLVHSCNTIAEARPEKDPVEEAMSII
jgi:hypothetical protein